MFKYVLSFLKKIFGFPKELLAKRKKAIDRKERIHIAKVFNDRYTYRVVYDESKPRLSGSYYGVQHSGGYAWMCPTCNKIHHPIEESVFVGLLYPKCCNYPYGQRWDGPDKIRTR